VIRIRGVPIGDEDVRELVQRLENDESAAELAGRLRRALGNGRGLVGTDRAEARALLDALDRMLGHREPYERLLELRASLVGMISRHA
jgi:hypothetical protein